MLSKFLNFKGLGLIVNIHHIHSIVVEPNIYTIYLMSNKFDGKIVWGSGNISSEGCYVSICEKKNPADYKTLSEWIIKET